MSKQSGQLLRGVVLALALFGGVCHGADPDLMGLLALATQDDVTEGLGLSADQQKQLDELVLKREDAALAESSKYVDLKGEALRTALRPFRIETQRQMAMVLSDQQLAQLSKLGAKEGNPSYEAIESAPAEASPAPTAEAEAFAAQVTAPPPEGEAPAAEQPSETQPPARRSVLSSGEEESPAADDVPAATDEPSAEEPIEPAAEFTPEEAAEEAAVEEKFNTEGRLRFNFRYQPWQDVLDWFAEQSDLSLVLESPPSGTFNYTDSRSYTPAEALDVLNSVLLVKGYTLVRRGRMLVLVNLEDFENGVPPNLVTDVDLKELDDRSEYELIRVLFPVRNMTPAVAAEEVQKLVGPQGSVVVLPRAGMIQVVETAGRLRKIRDVIEAVEGPEPTSISGVKPFDLEYAAATEVMPIVRQMLGIPADGNNTPDNTLHVAIDTTSNARLLAQGTPEMLKRLQEIIDLVDAEPTTSSAGNTLQLEVYSTGQSDPNAVLLVMQSLLAETPGTRLTTDPQTGNLIALATPANHATIRATLGQMQQDLRQVEVIPLQSVDPQLAVLSITKLFGISAESDDPRQPIIDADLSTRSLLVRANQTQIDQIRELLSKMGESEESSLFSGSDRGNVRILDFTASETRAAMEQLGDIWPTLRSNPLQLVKPATAIRAFRPAETAPHSSPVQEEAFDWRDILPGLNPLPQRPAAEEGAEPPAPADNEARHTAPRGVPVRSAVFQQQAAPDEPADEPPRREPNESTPQGNSVPPSNAAPGEVRESKPGAPIYVAPGPNGLMIASDDLDALDTFERLLEATAEQSLSSTREYAVFYLRHAKAPAAAAILAEIFGATSGGAGGDSLLGGIADAALGDIGGGLMGDLLGLGGGGGAVGGFSSGAVDIVTDNRLNALIIYARPDDIETVNRLLQVIDQRIGPTDVEADGVPRLIPVYNRSAADIAAIVKSQFSNRIEGGPGGQPNPEELLRALRGGQGGAADSQEPTKMSVDVDARSNSLVVRAPDSLFTQVEALVEQLDSDQEDGGQATTIVTLRHSNIETVKAALAPITAAQTGTSPAQPGQAQPGGGAPDQQEVDRRRQEFFRRIMEQQQRGGGGDRGGRGGGDRGGGDRGGRGGGGGRGR